jgi:hypothetical protein
MAKKDQPFGKDAAGHQGKLEKGISPWVISFNRKELEKRSSKALNQKKFINAVNYVHFSEGQIFFHAGSKDSTEDYLIRVYPEPCQGPVLKCRLPEGFSYDARAVSPRNLIIDDGKSILCMPVDEVEISGSHLTAKMNETCFAFSARRARRFSSILVHALVLQENTEGRGTLVDFSPDGFRIEVMENTLAALNPAKSLSLDLFKAGRRIYNGSCRIVRIDRENRSVVLAPYGTQHAIYRKKKLRNPRLNLVPSPRISYTHPLSGREVCSEITEMTPTGFSVREDADQSVLIPGMIIGGLAIVYAGGLKINCDAQVIYCKKKGRNLKHFGCAIIDMDIVSYNRIFDIVSKAWDAHANVSREVNMEALWQFFFETGFIYPRKYATLSEDKEVFKNTYDLLYKNSPEIFANFTYQKNGGIYGHVSIIKAYQRSWMIHHLAAKSMGRKPTGLNILNHILNYFDGLYRMPTIGMDYMIFYFRPDNRFPDYFFGGFCRDFDNPKACSMDLFAYVPPHAMKGGKLGAGWEVGRCTEADREGLSRWYDRVSGGLMVNAFCLETPAEDEEPLEETYAKSNLKRSYSLAKLTRGGRTRAYFLVDQSDTGINLSDLLNSIKVMVVDREGLTRDVLMGAVSSLESLYGIRNVPVLVYPSSYADEAGIEYDKKYNLWVLSSKYGDDYSEHLKQKAQFKISKLIAAYITSRFKKK